MADIDGAYPGSATYPDAGQFPGVPPAATLSESSTMTASPRGTTSGAAVLSETASLSASAKYTARPTSGMSETATLTASLTASTWSVSLDMSETVTLSANASTIGTITPAPSTGTTTNAYVPPTADNSAARNEWRAFVFDTASGSYETELPLAGLPQFTYALNDPGSGSVPVALAGPDAFDKNLLDQYSENPGWRWSIGVAYNDVILQAGPILGDSYTDPSPQTSLTFAGIWRLFSRRVILSPQAVSLASPTDPSANSTYTNVTLRQLAKLVLRDNFISQGPLPIDLPDDDPNTGSVSETYYGYDLNLVADTLTHLATTDGGPEIEFRPYWADPLTIRWHMRTGSNRLGVIGAPWTYDYGGRGALVTLDKASDSSNTAFGYYARGSGSQDAQPIGYSADMTLPDLGFPLLLAVDGNHTSETDVSVLNSYATADVNTYKNPVVTYAATVRMNGTDAYGRPTGSPNVNQLNVGDTLTVHVEGHTRIPDGDLKLRVISIQNGDSHTCRLALQTTS